MPPQGGRWAPIYQSLWTHWKTFELAALLGINETYAGGHLARLWTWAIDNAPDGDVSRLSDRAIAHGAGWTQEVSLFVGALVKAGFMDEDRRLHDWSEYAGKLVEKRQSDAERKRESREMSAGHAPDVRGTSHGASGPVRGKKRQDKTREEEKREPENTTTPNPSASGGERAAGAAGNPGRRSGRRRGESEPAGSQSAPSPEVAGYALSPLTSADHLVWSAALAVAAADMSEANGAMLVQLQPVGRSADGAMLLRAPPGRGLERFRGTLARALLDAGDAAGPHVTIFEG